MAERDIDELIERSSLGTEGAKRLRKRATASSVEAVVGKIERGDVNARQVSPAEELPREISVDRPQQLRDRRHGYRFDLTFSPGISLETARDGLRKIAEDMEDAGGDVITGDAFNSTILQVPAPGKSRLPGDTRQVPVVRAVLLAWATADLAGSVKSTMDGSNAVQHVSLERVDAVQHVSQGPAGPLVVHFNSTGMAHGLEDLPVEMMMKVEATNGPNVGRFDVDMEHVEYRESLRPLLASLPARERTILTLRFFGNQTQAQIADEVGISQMHVARLLARTLAGLRERQLLTDGERGGDSETRK